MGIFCKYIKNENGSVDYSGFEYLFKDTPLGRRKLTVAYNKVYVCVFTDFLCFLKLTCAYKRNIVGLEPFLYYYCFGFTTCSFYKLLQLVYGNLCIKLTCINAYQQYLFFFYGVIVKFYGFSPLTGHFIIPYHNCKDKAYSYIISNI